MSTVPSDLFREALRQLPTGVTVLTGYGNGRLLGMTANSVTSVSLDPPLMLVCPAKTSSTWRDLRAGRQFCINVVAAHHDHVCRQFARRGVDRFDGIEFYERSAGPALSDALAWIDCEIRVEHDAGDHSIVVADVLSLDARPGAKPLIFFGGELGTFAPRTGERRYAEGVRRLRRV